MKVELNVQKGYCKVTKEAGDPRFHYGGWGVYTGAESTFLYHVLQELKKQGYDVIKKRMWRDGHLVDDNQQYIRTRSYKGKPDEFTIWNSRYAIEDAGKEFNKYGEYVLRADTTIEED